MKKTGQLVARQSVKKDGYVLTGYYDKVKFV